MTTTKKEPKRIYTAPDGKQYPLYEAPYAMPVTVFKSDRKKAQIGDPQNCLIALGLRRQKGVEAAWVGCGQDAYVCFGATKLRAAYALHFTVGAQSSRVRDFFDTHKDVETQTLQLDPPSPGRTLAARSKANKRRREEVKNGATVTKREVPRVTRMVRLGVARRPKATIKKNQVVAPPSCPAKPQPQPQPATAQQQQQDHAA